MESECQAFLQKPAKGIEGDHHYYNNFSSLWVYRSTAAASEN